MTSLHTRSTPITRSALNRHSKHMVFTDALPPIAGGSIPHLYSQESIGWGRMDEKALELYEEIAATHNFLARPIPARNMLDSIQFDAAQASELRRPLVVFPDSSREAPDFRQGVQRKLTVF